MTHRDLIWKWAEFKEAAAEAEAMFSESKLSYLVYMPDIDQFNATNKPLDGDYIIDTLEVAEDGLIEHEKYGMSELTLMFGFWGDIYLK